MSDDIIEYYRKASEDKDISDTPIQEPVCETVEPTPVLPVPEEPFDKFLVQLAETLKQQKDIGIF